MTDFDPAPIVKPARYAKGKMAVFCASNGTGLKTRAMRLCDAVSARYSHRERAYIMSPTAAKRVLELYRADLDYFGDGLFKATP
jgi:hypothetical protein